MKTMNGKRHRRSSKHASGRNGQAKLIGYNLTKDLNSIKKAIRGRASALIEKSLEVAKDHSADVSHNVAAYAKLKPFKTIGIAMLSGAALAAIVKKII